MAYYETLVGTSYEIIPILDYPTWPSACNQGYKQSKGDVLHFGADDLEPLEGWYVPALFTLSVSDVLPAARVFDLRDRVTGEFRSDGKWLWANPTDGDNGQPTRFTRVPIMTRSQYERIGLWPHIDYYADVWLSEKARTLGIETHVVFGYDFRHHWSQIGRVDSDENMNRAGAEFNRLVEEMQ